jgi:hypothetical protein
MSVCAIGLESISRARLCLGILHSATSAVQQTAHEETFGLSLNPPIEPIHHFLLSRERKLVRAVENERVKPLRLAYDLI